MGAEPTIVQHPNLLLNSQGIEAIREKIRNQPWAAALFEKLKASANTGLQDGLRNTVLLYALTGEKSYGDSAHDNLLNDARYSILRIDKVDLDAEPEAYVWNAWEAKAWACDLCYDTFSAPEWELAER